MNDASPFTDRARRVHATALAEQLAAAFGGDAAQAEAFASDTEGDPDRLLAVVDGKALFLDRFKTAGVGAGVADQFTGIALALQGGPGGSIADVGVALRPHEALLLLADLALALEDTLRSPVHQTPDMDAAARAVELGLAEIQLSSERRRDHLTAAARTYRDGVEEGMAASIGAIDAMEAELGDKDGKLAMLRGVLITSLERIDE